MPVLSIEKVPEDGHATGRYVHLIVKSFRLRIGREEGRGEGGIFAEAKNRFEGSERERDREKEKKGEGGGRSIGRVVRIKVQRGGNAFLFICASRAGQRRSDGVRASLELVALERGRDKCAYLYPAALEFLGPSSPLSATVSIALGSLEGGGGGGRRICFRGCSKRARFF